MTSLLALDDARLDLGLSVGSLWLSYFALGGTKTQAELTAYLLEGDREGFATSDADHDAVVHALNEAYLDRGADYPVAYRSGSAGVAPADLPDRVPPGSRSRAPNPPT